MSKTQETFLNRVKKDMEGNFIASVFVSKNETMYIYDRKHNKYYIQEQGQEREQVTEKQFFTYLKIDIKMETEKTA